MKGCSQVIWTRSGEEKKLISVHQSGLYGISNTKLKQQKQPGGVAGLGVLANQDLKAWCKRKKNKEGTRVFILGNKLISKALSELTISESYNL